MLDNHEWLALCRAVIQNQADDLPRLIAADWLEDHGQPERAEFMRVQLELAHERTSILLWREKALWNELVVGTLWPVELAPALMAVKYNLFSRTHKSHSSNIPDTQIRFQRGFPDMVLTTARHWLDYGCELVPQYPIRTVRLQNCSSLHEQEWWRMKDCLHGVANVELDYPVPLANVLVDRFHRANVILKTRSNHFANEPSTHTNDAISRRHA